MCESPNLSNNAMSVEGGACCEEEKEGSDTVHDGNPPECGSIAEILDNGAAEENAYTDAEIPAGEEGGVSCASLVIGGYTDDHVLEGRPEMSIAKSNEDGSTVVAHHIGTSHEEQVADGGGEDADTCIIDEPALAQHLASLQT